MIRTDRYGRTRIHMREEDVAHSPEQKIANTLAKRGIANRALTMRVRDVLAENPSLSIAQACAYVVHKAGA